MGTLYWITGLSGAGKTTISKEFVTLLKKTKSHVVFLDGDMLREVFGVKKAFSREERLDLALQYCRLCKVLTQQNLDVVCATISMFKECHDFNREQIKNYCEIYLKVPMGVLRKRDSKEIYSRAEKGELTQVMGVDLDFHEPENPDLVLNNDGTEEPSNIAKVIYEHFN